MLLLLCVQARRGGLSSSTGQPLTPPCGFGLLQAGGEKTLMAQQEEETLTAQLSLCRHL